jgi:hypothetical protein
MLGIIAAELAPALAGKAVAPDYEVPPRQNIYPGGGDDLISALNLLCQRRGWHLPE